MKKLTAILLTAMMTLSMGVTAFGAQAYESDAKISLNNEGSLFLQAYNIDGYTYFGLREVCGALQGTVNEFDLNWNSGEKMTVIKRKTQGVPIISMGYIYSGSIKAVPVDVSIQVDGEMVTLKAYNINNYNYFKLRDMADLIGFELGWNNATKTINIISPYGAPENASPLYATPIDKPVQNQNSANGSFSVLDPDSEEYQELVEEVKYLTSGNLVSEKEYIQEFIRGEYFDPLTVTFRDDDEDIYFKNCTFHSTLTVKGDYKLGENFRLINCTFANDSDLILK